MKNLFSKITLLLLCSAFVLSSCTKEGPDDKKSVTIKYRILVNGEIDAQAGIVGGGIDELNEYTKKEVAAVAAAHDKDSWLISSSADTEEAAIAACDQKATAIFDVKLAVMNAASASVKAKFDIKKESLLSKIELEASTSYVKYLEYGAYLFKGKASDFAPGIVVKKGTMHNMEAVGGKK